MDITLHYTEQGSGPPLILLHGNGEDGSYFVHQIEYFKDRYRVIALDTRDTDSRPVGRSRSPSGSLPRICMILWMNSILTGRISSAFRTAAISLLSLP